MSLLVVGSVAYDALESPYGKVERTLGGAATYFSVSASFFTHVNLVAIVGDDFDRGIPREWHDLRHEALSRLADDGVPVHELQMLTGHASITTTQRYMNARANSLAGSMREARERRARRLGETDAEQVQVG